MPKISFKKENLKKEKNVTPVIEETDVITSAEESETALALNVAIIDALTPEVGVIKGFAANQSYSAPWLSLVAKLSAIAEDDTSLIGQFYTSAFGGLGTKIFFVPLAVVSYYEENWPFNTKHEPNERRLVWETEQAALKDGFMSSVNKDINDTSLKLYNNTVQALIAVDVSDKAKNDLAATISVKDTRGDSKTFIALKFKVRRGSCYNFSQPITDAYRTILQKDLLKGTFSLNVIKKPYNTTIYYAPQTRLEAKTDPKVYEALRQAFGQVKPIDIHEAE